MSELRQLRAILALPFAVTVLIPFGLWWRWGADGSASIQSLWPSIGPFGQRSIGLAIGATGLALMGTTIRLFATRGEGTLAPWDPTQKLVVEGIYRRVRNPMITGVALVLLGEGVALGSSPILTWALLFFLGNAIYMPLSEEPGLERRFGDDYREYCRHVPRWIPRLRAWDPRESATSAAERDGRC